MDCFKRCIPKEETVVQEKYNAMGRLKIDVDKKRPASKINSTFSKRKDGLMNKAKQMGSLCDVDVALIVFCPRGDDVIDVSHGGTIDEVYQRYVRFRQRHNRPQQLVYRPRTGPRGHQEAPDPHPAGNVHSLNLPGPTHDLDGPYGLFPDAAAGGGGERGGGEGEGRGGAELQAGGIPLSPNEAFELYLNLKAQMETVSQYLDLQHRQQVNQQQALPPPPPHPFPPMQQQQQHLPQDVMAPPHHFLPNPPPFNADALFHNPNPFPN